MRLLLSVFLLASMVLTMAPLPTPATAGPVDRESDALGSAFLVVEDENGREKAASKMEEALLRQLRNQPDGLITAIVHLGGEADLSGAAAFVNRAERGAHVYGTLRAFAADRQRGIRAYLADAQRAGTVRTWQPFFIFNGVAVTARPAVIWEIAARRDVEALTASHTYHLDAQRALASGPVVAASRAPEWNISQINADEVWTALGVTGAGVLVANMDSGVQYNHPALVEQYAGNAGSAFDHDYHWYDATGVSPLVPLDDNGHGTHTMGTILGGDGPGPFVDDVGVAPGASWIAAKAFSAAGTGATEDIHAAFEWLLAPCPAGVPPGDPSCDPAKAPAVVNNSWGSASGARIEFLPDVQALRAAGIWPAFSAGNNGPGVGSVGSPGSFAESFATGATDANDLIADFSGRGPSPLTDEIKPDVVAPGVAVRSSVPTNSYAAVNGTSMACPHSVGLAALLLSAAPNLDLEALEEIMRSTAVDLGDAGPDMVYGYGRIDALRSVQRLVSSGDLTGSVRDAATLEPLAGVPVRAQGQGLDLSATTDSSGVYTMTYLISGPYSLTAAFYGYHPVTLTNVSVVTGLVTVQDLDMVARPHYTLSGHVYDAVSTTVPITHAVVWVLDTPLPPAPVDASGHYSLVVAEGPAVIEAAAFSFATGLIVTDITTDTVIDFFLDPLPPILLVDDDEGDLRNYSPHVQGYYFSALDSNGYNYDYWDIEEFGAPDFDTIRQYAAVLWFGGEFGRIKDISDADQAQQVMDYLDIGGRFFYISQEHTFYYGDDADCDSPTWGGTGPCHFTEHYLGVADWVEDQKAQVTYGVAGNPVGDGLGPIVMAYPPGLADFSDDIAGALTASLAITATDSPGEVNLTAYTLVSPTLSFKTVFFATPLEAMPAPDAADVVYAAMEWFGVAGLAEGLTLSPAMQEGMALPGDTITFTLRVRNLSPISDTFDLALVEAPWSATIVDPVSGGPISQLGPISSRGTADFAVLVQVPAGASPGAEATLRVRAVSRSGTPYADEAQLLAKSRMVYYGLDSDQCDSGVHFEWVDATMGERWDLDDSGSTPEPEYVAVPLPQPFVFYNRSYDHMWVNDHGTILFGDDNIYDDSYPSGTPPIPNPTMTDPNGAIYMAWGTSFWHPSDQHPDSAVYTYHDTSGGRNWFVVEYHRYENLMGSGPDTFEAILDLDSYEITVQYHTVTYSNWAVVGIENQTGAEGILYVNDQQPPENTLHDGLALRFGLGEPPEVIEVWMSPPAVWGTGAPGGVVTYTLTVSSTSNITDSYTLEVGGANWPTTLWDPTFSAPIGAIGPLEPCAWAQIGVQVELPPDASYVLDRATLRARSQTNTLIAASSQVTTDNAVPAVQAGPNAAGGAFSGQTLAYSLWVTNTGNITDVYSLSLSGSEWPTQFGSAITQTAELPPGDAQRVTVQVTIPPSTPAGDEDSAVLSAQSQRYLGTEDSVTISTEALSNVAVAWEQPYQERGGQPNWVVSYYLVVRNAGNVDDAFALDALAADWETSLWNDSFTSPITQTHQLGPDATQRIGVRVRVPAAAAAPDQDATLVRATSTVDSGVEGYALLVTSATPPPPGTHGVSLAPAGDRWLATPGQTVTYTLRITNTGSVTDSYTLSVVNNRWPVQAPTAVPELAPSAGAWLRVVVTVPSNAVEAGDLDQAAVIATSAGDPNARDRADLVTLVPGLVPRPPHTLFLPIVLR